MSRPNPGSFEQWITATLPFPTMPPREGSTGTFERWLGAGLPFASYAVTLLVSSGAGAVTLGAIGQASDGDVGFGRIASLGLYWVDIEDGSGNKYGSGPLRPMNFQANKALSASGTFSFQISVADPNLAVLAEKCTAICRYFDGNTIQVFGGGVIDKIMLSMSPAGLIYTITGNDLSRELTYRSVGTLTLALGSDGVTDGPEEAMAVAPAGWTIGGGITETPVYGVIDGDTVLNTLVQIGKKIGEHWRMGRGREIIWLGPATGFGDSGVRAVQHVNDPVAAESQAAVAVIAALEEETDATDLVTRVIPRGSGTGNTILTLAAATDSAPAGYTLDTTNNFVKYDAGEAAYGRIERVVDFKDITPVTNTTGDVQAAANALLENAYQYLRLYGAAHKFYKLTLASCNQLLEPGTTLRVVYRQLMDGVVVKDIDEDLIILTVTQALDETGLHTAQVEVSTIDRMPAADGAVLASQIASSKILATHQQLGPSVDNLTWRDEMDKDHAASLRFWLGKEYTVVQAAILRFRIQPLRATVKAVDTTTETSSSDGDHQHFTTIPQASGNTTAEWYADGGEITPVTPSVSGLTMPTGAGGAHTHTITPAVSLVYGIFEEISGNTLGLVDLVIKLNGGSNLAGSVTDAGSGWKQLDITPTLVSAIFRPTQENNELVISTATDVKTARIEAQLTIRGVVQAVAFS